MSLSNLYFTRVSRSPADNAGQAYRGHGKRIVFKNYTRFLIKIFPAAMAMIFFDDWWTQVEQGVKIPYLIITHQQTNDIQLLKVYP